jgi:hypothetical protein
MIVQAGRMAASISMVVLLGCTVKSARVQPPAAGADPETPRASLPAAPEKQQPSNSADSKLDSALLSLSQATKAGKADQKVKDLSAQLDFKEGKVKVEIVALRTAPIESLKQQLASTRFEMTAELENHLWGYLPVGAIDDVSKMDQVWTLSAATPTVSAR